MQIMYSHNTTSHELFPVKAKSVPQLINVFFFSFFFYKNKNVLQMFLS